MPPLELYRRHPAAGTMSTTRVVKHFDVVEDIGPGFGMVDIDAPLDPAEESLSILSQATRETIPIDRERAKPNQWWRKGWTLRNGRQRALT